MKLFVKHFKRHTQNHVEHIVERTLIPCQALPSAPSLSDSYRPVTLSVTVPQSAFSPLNQNSRK